MIKRIYSALARRGGALPLKLLGPDLRAQVLEKLSDEMVTETRVPGGRIRFYTPSTLLQWRAASVLTKETDMIEWIAGMSKSSVLWDIGANVGVFSLYAAVCQAAKVLAFEPAAANFEVLTRNVQLNGVSDRVTAYCLAFAGRTELGVLNLPSHAMGAALSQFGKRGEVSRYLEGAEANIVQGMIGYSVDEFVAQFSPLLPTHLKMDVDGLELPILQGAARFIREPGLLSMMVELSVSNTGERDQAVALIEAAGFHLVSQGEIQGTENERAANHLFMRPG
jgi:FkbM family methyltransferase